jgi:hypothetical protein
LFGLCGIMQCCHRKYNSASPTTLWVVSLCVGSLTLALSSLSPLARPVVVGVSIIFSYQCMALIPGGCGIDLTCPIA